MKVTEYVSFSEFVFKQISKINAVYFNLGLGAAHFKRCLKYAFSRCVMQKVERRKKKQEN